MDLLQVIGLNGRFNFSLVSGVKLAVAGETGSGKSTLLKMIAGLVQPVSGSVLFEGRRVLGPLERLVPGEPGIAYLSQHFELWNNYRVSEILSYANDLSSSESAELYAICRIDHLLGRRTDQLSGGERQRIALARLLVSPPRLLLLDEPFSNLDMIHKGVLKEVVRDIGERLGITCMLVSHDPLDLMGWADEILVLSAGAIVQRGSPVDVYRSPVSEYVAGLFGKYNVIDGRFVRPEAVRFVSWGERGVVEEVIFQGSYYEVTVLASSLGRVVVRTSEAVMPGATVFLGEVNI